MYIKNYIKNIFKTFIDEKVKQTVSIYFFSAVGLFSLLLFGIYGIIEGAKSYTYTIFFFLLVTIAILLFLKLTKKVKLASHLVVLLYLAFTLVIFADLGKNETGYFWSYIFPMVSIFLIGHRIATIYSVALAIAISIQIKYSVFELPNTYNPNIATRYLFTYLVVVVLTDMFEYVKVITFKAFYKIYSEKVKLLKESEDQKEKVKMLAEEESTLNEELKQRNEEMESINNELESKQNLIEKQNKELASTIKVITQQQEKISEINEEVKQSIIYGSTIQKALHPSKRTISNYFKEYLVLSKPKEAVSGDFYYVNKVDDWILFAVADCTGHGVPGAFLSMLGITYLHEITTRHEAETTGDALNTLRKRFKNIFSQFGNENNNGMDIALCAVNYETNILQFSGAFNPLIMIRGDKLTEYKANRNPIGMYPVEKPFETTYIELQDNDLLYIFSDGFYDQFGGARNKKFSKKRFKEVLFEIRNMQLDEQKLMLNSILKNWQGIQEQVDDITVIGIKYQK